MYFTQRFSDNLRIVIDEITADADALDRLQRLWDAYDAEAERLRELYGTADTIGDDISSKSYDALSDFVITQSSVSDWYCSEDNEEETDEFLTELDRTLIEEVLS